MNPYKYRGAVHFISPVQTFQSGFAKRTLVLSDDSGKYTNYAAFDFTRSKDGTRDGTKLLDKLLLGEQVEVTFFLEANESKKSPGSWFLSNRAIKLDRLDVSDKPNQPAHEEAKEPDQQEASEDLPF